MFHLYIKIRSHDTISDSIPICGLTRYSTIGCNWNKKSVMPYLFNKIGCRYCIHIFKNIYHQLNVEVDSDVGSEPEYVVPPLLSKTLYTL